jgi:hypothetical protein
MFAQASGRLPPLSPQSTASDRQGGADMGEHSSDRLPFSAVGKGTRKPCDRLGRGRIDRGLHIAFEQGWDPREQDATVSSSDAREPSVPGREVAAVDGPMGCDGAFAHRGIETTQRAQDSACASDRRREWHALSSQGHERFDAILEDLAVHPLVRVSARPQRRSAQRDRWTGAVEARSTPALGLRKRADVGVPVRSDHVPDSVAAPDQVGFATLCQRRCVGTKAAGLQEHPRGGARTLSTRF